MKQHTTYQGERKMETRKHPAAAGSKWIRPDKRLAIYLRDDFRCAYCGQDLRGESPHNITLDHLVPVSQGGSNGEDNLVTACRSCNCSRGARSISDFAPGGSLKRIRELTILPLNRALAKAIIKGETGDPRLEEGRA